jgi:hypothetical protein
MSSRDASMASGLPVSVTMWTVQQKAQFVLWFAELKAVVAVQRKWERLHPGDKAPDDNIWYIRPRKCVKVNERKNSLICYKTQ